MDILFVTNYFRAKFMPLFIEKALLEEIEIPEEVVRRKAETRPRIKRDYKNMLRDKSKHGKRRYMRHLRMKPVSGNVRDYTGDGWSVRDYDRLLRIKPGMEREDIPLEDAMIGPDWTELVDTLSFDFVDCVGQRYYHYENIYMIEDFIPGIKYTREIQTISKEEYIKRYIEYTWYQVAGFAKKHGCHIDNCGIKMDMPKYLEVEPEPFDNTMAMALKDWR